MFVQFVTFFLEDTDIGSNCCYLQRECGPGGRLRLSRPSHWLLHARLCPVARLKAGAHPGRERKKRSLRCQGDVKCHLLSLCVELEYYTRGRGFWVRPNQEHRSLAWTTRLFYSVFSIRSACEDSFCSGSYRRPLDFDSGFYWCLFHRKYRSVIFNSTYMVIW